MSQLVLIGGGTASGKTTLARELENVATESAVLVSVDSFYRDQDGKAAEDRNYDEPAAFDMPLLVQQLANLRNDRFASIPDYDFVTHRRVGAQEIQPARLTICEGILALHDERIRHLAGIRIFVEASEELRFERRLKRDTRERGRTAESVKEQWDKTVQLMHQRYVEPTRAFADLVVQGKSDLKLAAKKIWEQLDLTEGASEK